MYKNFTIAREYAITCLPISFWGANMFKILMCVLFLISCGEQRKKDNFYLTGSDTYEVYNTTVYKSRSWYLNETGELYNTFDKVELNIRDANYLDVLSNSNFIENSYNSGFNTLRTKVNPKIVLDMQQLNKLAEFIDACAEEYGLNVILYVDSFEDTDLLCRLVKMTIHYPNLAGVEIPRNIFNFEEIAKIILTSNPEIMLFLNDKMKILTTNLPKSKIMIYL